MTGSVKFFPAQNSDASVQFNVELLYKRKQYFLTFIS